MSSKTKCKKDGFICKLVIAFINIAVNLIEHLINYCSTQLSSALEIRYNNLSIYVTKLQSSRSFLATVSYVSEPFVNNYLSEYLLYKGLVCLALISFSRFVLIIFLYFKSCESLLVYTALTIESFFASFYKISIFTIVPEYTSILMVSADISGITIFMFENGIECLVDKNPLLIIKSQCWLCFLTTATSTGAWYLLIKYLEFQQNQSDQFNIAINSINEMKSKSDELEQETKKLFLKLDNCQKINNLNKINDLFDKISNEISKIEDFKKVDEPNYIKQFHKQIPEDLSTYTNQSYRNIVLGIIKQNNLNLEKKDKNPNKSDKDILKNLDEILKPNLSAITNVSEIINEVIVYIEYFYKNHEDEIRTFKDTIKTVKEKLSNLKNKIQEIKNNSNKIFELINEIGSITVEDEHQLLWEQKVHNLKGILKNLTSTTDLIGMLNQTISNTNLSEQATSIEQQKELIETLKNKYQINQDKTLRLLSDINSQIDILNNLKELKVIFVMKKFDHILSKKDSINNYINELMKIYEFLNQIELITLSKKSNLSNTCQKNKILHNMNELGFKKLSKEQNDSNAENPILQKFKSFIKSLDLQKADFNEAISKIEQQNAMLIKLSSVNMTHPLTSIQDLQRLNPSNIKSQLESAETSLQTFKSLGLNLVPHGLNEMAIKVSQIASILPNAISDLNNLSQIDSIKRNIKSIDFSNVRNQYNQLLENGKKALTNFNEISTKIEANDIEELLKIKWDLNPEKLDFKKLFDSYNHLPGVSALKQLIDQLKPILKFIQSIETKPNPDIFIEQLYCLIDRSNLDIKEFINKIKQSEEEIDNLYIKYKSPIPKYNDLTDLENEIQKNEREILDNLQKVGLLKGTPEVNKISTKLQELRHKLESIVLSKLKDLQSHLPVLSSAKSDLSKILDKIKSGSIKQKDTEDIQLNNIRQKLEAFLKINSLKFIDQTLVKKIKPLNRNIQLTSDNVRQYKKGLNTIPIERKFLQHAITFSNKINIDDIADIWNAISSLKNNQIVSKIDQAKTQIFKLEREMNIDQLLKLKVQLDPTKLDLEEDFKYIEKTRDELNLLSKVSKVKKQLESLNKLEKDKSKAIELQKKYEKEKLEKGPQTKNETVKEIEKKEQQQLEELRTIKQEAEDLREKKKKEISSQSQQLISIINVIQTKINEFGPFDHIMNTISQFTIATTTTSITHVVHPGVLPLAIVEISDCELINLYTPLFYVIGSGAVFCINMFFPDVLKEWLWYCNLVWILLVPQLVIMTMSFITVHTKSKCSEQIRNSKSRIFLMLSFLLVSYSLMESMSYVGVANYVVYKSKYFKSSIDVIRYFLILISVVKFLTYKLSVGYNIVRVKHGYVAPKFEPYVEDKKPNCCYLFLDVLLRSLIDIFLDFRLNIRDYT